MVANVVCAAKMFASSSSRPRGPTCELAASTSMGPPGLKEGEVSMGTSIMAVSYAGVKAQASLVWRWDLGARSLFAECPGFVVTGLQVASFWERTHARPQAATLREFCCSGGALHWFAYVQSVLSRQCGASPAVFDH